MFNILKMYHLNTLGQSRQDTCTCAVQVCRGST
jgi:hypothetical protein